MQKKSLKKIGTDHKKKAVVLFSSEPKNDTTAIIDDLIKTKNDSIKDNEAHDNELSNRVDEETETTGEPISQKKTGINYNQSETAQTKNNVFILDKALFGSSGKLNLRQSSYYILFAFTILIVAVCIWKFIANENKQTPLSDEEINLILDQYEDSLKQDLFDGFYLSPMRKDDREDSYVEDENIIQESTRFHCYCANAVIWVIFRMMI